MDFLDRWPGIICSDIVPNNFASFDNYGDIEHYHVEYFGDPRTHSWVLAKNVEMYGSGNAPLPFHLTSHKGMATGKSRKSFQKAILQADKLIHLEAKDRLENCFFKTEEESDCNGGRFFLYSFIKVTMEELPWWSFHGAVAIVELP